jgi:hypothetical protein
MTCENGTVAEDDRGDCYIRCNVLRQRIRRPIITCTDHLEKNEPDLYDMKQIAWILTLRGKNKVAGFVRACDLSSKERRRLDAEVADG